MCKVGDTRAFLFVFAITYTSLGLIDTVYRHYPCLMRGLLTSSVCTPVVTPSNIEPEQVQPLLQQQPHIIIQSISVIDGIDIDTFKCLAFNVNDEGYGRVTYEILATDIPDPLLPSQSNYVLSMLFDGENLVVEWMAAFGPEDMQHKNLLKSKEDRWISGLIDYAALQTVALADNKKKIDYLTTFKFDEETDLYWAWQHMVALVFKETPKLVMRAVDTEEQIQKCHLLAMQQKEVH